MLPVACNCYFKPWSYIVRAGANIRLWILFPRQSYWQPKGLIASGRGSVQCTMITSSQTLRHFLSLQGVRHLWGLYTSPSLAIKYWSQKVNGFDLESQHLSKISTFIWNRGKCRWKLFINTNWFINRKIYDWVLSRTMIGHVKSVF